MAQALESLSRTRGAPAQPDGETGAESLTPGSAGDESKIRGDGGALTAGFNQLLQRVMDYRIAKILLVANELDISSILARGRLPVETLAEQLGTDPRATRILLDALVSIGLLRKTADQSYENLPMSDRFLVKGSPDYKGHNLSYQSRVWDFWSDLEGVVRRGKPRRVLASLLTDEQFTDPYIRGMEDIAGPFADEVMSQLNAPPGSKFLDVGGGPGTFSVRFVNRFPKTMATILDLPDTLRITAELVEREGLQDRIRLLPQNYLQSDLPAGQDFVLMSHITHDEGTQANQQLVDRAYKALRPGGTLLIHDFTVNATRTAPLFGALFSVNMLVYTASGETYRIEDYHQWMRESGFEDLDAVPILSGKIGNSTTLIMGRRPMI